MDNFSHNPRAPRTGGERIPLSFAQQGLWLSEQLEPGNAFNNITTETRLPGTVDTRVLERCLNEIIIRHDVLRSTFMQSGDQVVQTISPELTLNLVVIDLSEIDEAMREQTLRQQIVNAGATGFDLQLGPLLRATLFRLSAQESLLLMEIHHIVFDGWSMGIVNRELEALYSAYREGQPSPLALPARYADYAIRQRQELHGHALEKPLAYWKQILAGAPRLELPFDRPVPARPDYRIERMELRLPAELSAAIKQLAAGENCTQFMVLAAAFKLLLHRYSGQEDIVVGIPVAGRRNRDGNAGLIGLFVNTIVLRTDLSGDPEFRVLLQRERQVALGAYRHAHLPFDKLVEELRPERKAGLNPYFDVMINYLDDSWHTLKLDGLPPCTMQRAEQQSGFALSLEIIDRTGGFSLVLAYQSALFSARKIHNLLNLHFQTLLQGITENPQARLSELPLLTAPERRRLLDEWNDTARLYPRETSVQQLFTQQAAKTPDAPALVHEEQQLTYAELNVRANRLALYLRGLGIKQDVRVGICMERCCEMIVAMLGILKAGGAYVPIDPAWPAERARAVIEDAALAAIVTRGSCAQHLPEKSTRLIHIECLPGPLPATNPEWTTAPSDLAYVLYTSGTTGRPKGVMTEHRHLLQYMWAISDRLALRSDGGYAMLQPLSVDSCLTMVFPALCRGGVLHLINEELALDAHGLAEYFRNHRIDYLKIAPSHLAALLDQLPAATLLPERALIIGGEPSHWEFIDRLWSLAPRCSMWNHYGPTETTVGVSAFRLEPTTVRIARTVPIGRPLANVRYYILDRNMQPVPIGVPGELYIGGSQMARGYLNDPKLTEARFVPETHNSTVAARMYKSGDHARYLPDGNVEFLGRSDGQVKIRGFRIELGEIEAVLLESQAVREVLVTAIATVNRSMRLVAYVTTAGAMPLNEAELQAQLRSRLPDYMMPSQFVRLEAMPLTPHGKIDRSALPLPPQAHSISLDTYVAPRNTLEEMLAEIWCGTLQLDRVSVHDNFFELGGHSLLCTQLVSKINRTFRIQIPLRSLFEKPTIAAQSEEIEHLQHLALTDGADLEQLLHEVKLLAAEIQT